jgi:hypothetical protein
MSSPFFYYNACFDPQKLIRQYAAPDLKPTPGYFTNFLGVIIDPKFFPDHLPGREGQIDRIPLPTNWHSEVAEWGAALRAVDTAIGPEFVMAELGCGWGCWMLNTGTAAKKRNLRVKLIGVEGDEEYGRYASKTLKENGFGEDEFEIHRGIAAAKGGTALFPRQGGSAQHWGLQPVFGASDAQIAEAIATQSYDLLPIIPLEEIFARHERIDLLHMDIQGGELDLVEQSMSTLKKKVVCLLIGTHSRPIEGGLFELLLEHGWQLEIERPALLRVWPEGPPNLTHDGVQAWRNLSLQRTLPPPEIASGTSFSVANEDLYFLSYFLGSGWSRIEKEIVWSEGKEVELKLQFQSTEGGRLFLDLMAFIPTPEFVQYLDVTADNVLIGTVAITQGNTRKKYYFDLPPRPDHSMLLKITIAQPVSPQEAGISADPRKLGIALYGFGMEAV